MITFNSLSATELSLAHFYIVEVIHFARLFYDSNADGKKINE